MDREYGFISVIFTVVGFYIYGQYLVQAMSILENFLNLVEKLDNKREAYLEAQERERVEYIKKHGHPPYSGNWCSTIEIQNRMELEFRKKMKAIMVGAKQKGKS